MNATELARRVVATYRSRGIEHSLAGIAHAAACIAVLDGCGLVEALEQLESAAVANCGSGAKE